MKITKPVGAIADLKELEYISALHQTGKNLRTDASIRADDIAKFLMSRYGIKVTEDEVTETIAKGFGGGGLSEDDGDTIDLTEIVSILLIPTLLKAEMSLHRNHLEREAITSKNSTGERPSIHNDKSGNDVWASLSGRPRALVGEERWPDYDLIGFVLNMILADVTGDDEPKPMTVDLLKKIFVFYGEHDVAENENLLKEMISVASCMKNADEEEGADADPTLNQFTFAHCLTDDVRRYDVKSENSLSTNFSDVFEQDGEQDHSLTVTTGESDSRKVKTVWTAPAVDYAVDTFRSRSYVTLLWVNWALFFYVYMSGNSGDLGQLNCSNDVSIDVSTPSGFACSIAQGIVNWLLIMAKLVILGACSVLFCSMGHSVTPSSPLMIVLSVLSMGCICVITFVPAFMQDKILTSGEDGGALVNTERDEKDGDQIFLIYVMVVFGILLLLLALQNFIERIIPARYLDTMPFLKKIISSGTVKMESYMKQASSFKMNQMIRNARAIHAVAEFEHGADSSSSKESSYGRALLAFNKKAETLEEVGGCCWTWKRMWNRKLYTEDGIWLNNRMVQGNVGQLVLCLYLIPFLQYVLGLLELFYESFLVDIAPARWRILVPLALAFTLSEFNALKLATSYTPSSVRTTLNFRSGMIGSLHNQEFQKVRHRVDDASFIFGAMFWGCLFSSILILIVSLLIFGLICFEPFLPIFLQVIATIIGIGITIMAKTIFLMFVRSKIHKRAYYRSNPAASNIIGVILDAWSLGITTLYILKRMVFLLFASFIFVGRIDIPFLAEGADHVGPMTLDMFPIIFRKDLLMHEAHRHPYLERIGVMYMLKLRHGDGFGTAAGTSWRLLFTFALLPWFRKYRIRSDDNIDVEKFKFSQDSAAFKDFVSAKAGGLRGRQSLATVKETEDSNDEDTEEQKTIASLKKKIESLMEENDMLKMMGGTEEQSVLPPKAVIPSPPSIATAPPFVLPSPEARVKLPPLLVDDDPAIIEAAPPAFPEESPAVALNAPPLPSPEPTEIAMLPRDQGEF
mmetsp:Transcript_21580/g.38070  ORF Transcript_21580/g.38070 Transcript_21580/m.38070 type:complete len:1026 (-) Transcript_21580:193-3270(-)|eukprot:CAMPEP_0201870150 /NCGR_PEP_ID=MMETSP0902-20130614/3364_1 /ASSEMBLY_ACC=CAM_ASM_000551 /TAXON_ID=420261 /ORGANISM="Thalassiosira antarctica, Strain CCMP982" /LENGTH=1025 /DNA_ID=CAMNT_0048395725 /DNA_START=50 /DNA_END=3127 /DNA_ORIENTATION=-